MLPIVTYPVAPLVSEIFDLKVADTHTHTQTDKQTFTLSDNKGPLKLSAREPISAVHMIHPTTLIKFINRYRKYKQFN